MQDYICTLSKNTKKQVVTASDFHKAIRNLYKQTDNMEPLRLEDLAQTFSVEKTELLEHLHTLETLDLVQFHDGEEVFSLTESGKLSNIP